jgi:chemotaxis protein CheX
MKVEYINPFVKAAFSVLRTVLNSEPVKGDLTLQPNVFTTHQCNVVFGVTGKVQGSVIFGMSRSVADRVASIMLDEPIKVFDQLAASAIAELGNITCGNALTYLAEAGYPCDITPPTVILGRAKILTLSVPAVVIPFNTQQGQLFLSIGLQEK